MYINELCSFICLRLKGLYNVCNFSLSIDKKNNIYIHFDSKEELSLCFVEQVIDCVKIYPFTNNYYKSPVSIYL